MSIKTALPASRLLTRDFLHIFALATAANVNLEVCHVCSAACAWACPITRSIHIALPDGDDEPYATALHELGHFCHPDGMQTSLIRSKNPEVQFREELAAWTWARQNAARWTPAMDRVAWAGLSGYRRATAA